MELMEGLTPVCQVCEVKDGLKLCGNCKLVSYCSRGHQISDWNNHKPVCGVPRKGEKGSTPDQLSDGLNKKLHLNPTNKTPNGINQPDQPSRASGSSPGPDSAPGPDSQPKAISTQGSSDSKPGAQSKVTSRSWIDPAFAFLANPKPLVRVIRTPQEDKEWILSCVDRVRTELPSNGVCVIDNLLGSEKALGVLQDVKNLDKAGCLQAGQVVASANEPSKKNQFRGDQVTWVTGQEPGCRGLKVLLTTVDSIVHVCAKRGDKRIGQHMIQGRRTKAMVTCYPGEGTRYVKHVDNPRADGRCITCIYYLNYGWTVESGGVLRFYGYKKQMEVAPLFDRLIFFWSDTRSPHEVLPAYTTRYATTVWYFDEVERREALEAEGHNGS